MDITECIEIFYNRLRKQARLGFLSPAAFERSCHEKTGSIKYLVSTIDNRPQAGGRL